MEMWQLPEAQKAIEKILQDKIDNIEELDLKLEIPYFFFSFAKRVEVLNKYLKQERRKNKGKKIKITVRRGYELEDSMNSLMKANLRHPIEVIYINEQGISELGVDAGGVFREYLHQVLERGLDPHRGLFLETQEKDLMPSALSTIYPDHLHYFYFLGKMVAKAILEQIVIRPVLSQVFLNQILQVNNTVEDLKLVDQQLYSNLMQLKHQQVGDHLGLDFTISSHLLGMQVEHELKPGGAHLPLTQDNKLEYIHLYAHYLLNQQVQHQAIAFQAGFRQLVNLSILKLFQPEELQRLISGAEGVDVDDLAIHTHLVNYSPTDNTILLFFKVVQEFSPPLQSRLLQFVTSCPRQPTRGFKDLHPPFTIVKLDNGQQSQQLIQHLPTASTCSNTLHLPDYLDYDLLKLKLTQAITSKSGFELA